MIYDLLIMRYYRPYHLVDPSPWPFVGGFGGFFTVLGAVVYFHYNRIEGLVMGLGIIVFIMIVWWRDVIRESTYQGKHTLVVKRGIKYGMVLFILSEVCLFFSFFWAFFHSSLSAAIEVGGV